MIFYVVKDQTFKKETQRHYWEMQRKEFADFAEKVFRKLVLKKMHMFFQGVQEM